jgi:pimeloyl-ACP methyl ester carboxylesterase
LNEPLVLLPGMMCDGRLFAPQIDALAPGRAIRIGDLSGHSTVAALAKSILATAPSEFALAGLSMGGIVAMEVIRQAPERVTRLALMDTNPKAEADAIKARRGPQIERARAGHLFAVMRDEMKPNYVTDGPERKAILDLCMDMAMTLGPEVFIRQSLALRDRPDQQLNLRKVTVPTLVLCGREDALCPIQRHTLMADLIPGATLEIIDGAGHMPTLEQPDLTTAALIHWLEA